MAFSIQLPVELQLAEGSFHRTVLGKKYGRSEEFWTEGIRKIEESGYRQVSFQNSVQWFEPVGNLERRGMSVDRPSYPVYAITLENVGIITGQIPESLYKSLLGLGYKEFKF